MNPEFRFIHDWCPFLWWIPSKSWENSESPTLGASLFFLYYFPWIIEKTEFMDNPTTQNLFKRQKKAKEKWRRKRKTIFHLLFIVSNAIFADIIKKRKKRFSWTFSQRVTIFPFFSTLYDLSVSRFFMIKEQIFLIFFFLKLQIERIFILFYFIWFFEWFVLFDSPVWWAKLI